MLTAILVMVVVVAAGVGVWIVGWLGCHQQANRGADLAALAGASAHLQSQDACQQARAIARKNGVELTGCRVQGDRRDFVVRVETRVALRPMIGGGPRWALGSAVAGSLPR